jgi:integrase
VSGVSLQKGHSVAIKKIKSGYQVDWRDDKGVRHRKSFKNKAEAEYYLSQQKLFDSSVGKARQSIAMKQLTVTELADRYIKEHLSLSRTSNNKCFIEVIKNKWGKDKLSRINPSDVKLWLKGLLVPVDGKLKYEVSTVRKIFAYFKRIFNWSIEMEIISSNPIEHIDLKKEFKRINKRKVVIETDQFWDLIGKLPADHAYLKEVAITAWSTGMRVGEIIRLQWKHVDMNSWMIRLSAFETKEADSKTIGIEPDFQKLLTELKMKRSDDPEELVFKSSTGTPIDIHCLDRAFRKYADKAGYAFIRLHDFRHCFTRRKRRQGFDRSVIKAQTGHHTDSMFDWYDKVDEAELQAMAGTMEKGLDQIAEDVQKLVAKAVEAGVSLGSLQWLIGRNWIKKTV